MSILQVICAYLTFRLIHLFTRSYWIAILGGGITLVDRDFCGVAAGGRPEVVACIVLLTLILMLADSSRTNEGMLSRAIKVSCMFLLPIVHPTTLFIGFFLSFYLLWRARKQGERLLPAAKFLFAYIAGCAAFACYFLAHSAALSQFKDHAFINSLELSKAGGGLLRCFRFVYPIDGVFFPLYSPVFIYALAIGCCVMLILQKNGTKGGGVPSETSDDGASLDPSRMASVAIPIVVFLSAIASTFALPNPVYLTIVLPVVTLLGILFLLCVIKVQGQRRIAIVCGVLSLLLCYHGLTLLTRFQKFAKAGFPNFPSEIHKIVEQLPIADKVLIPDLLWEECVHRSERYIFATLPQRATPKMRIAYENYSFGMLHSGDLLVFNRIGAQPYSIPLDLNEWDLIQHYEHLFNDRYEWGYDVNVYRKR